MYVARWNGNDPSESEVEAPAAVVIQDDPRLLSGGESMDVVAGCIMVPRSGG